MRHEAEILWGGAARAREAAEASPFIGSDAEA
jgi:hypothetical protein